MPMIPNRKYTREFQEPAVNQGSTGWRSIAEVARSLEMSDKTLSNWARRRQPLSYREGTVAVTDVQAELSRLRTENAQLKWDKDILKKAAAYFVGRVAVRYAWIGQYRDIYPVARSCAVFGVARSGYYAWQGQAQRPSARQRENARLLVELHARHQRHRHCYGSPRMTADLRAAGWTINRKRVARVMRQAGLRARGRCRRRYTTQSTHAYPVASNRLAQQFTVPAPERVWVTDITYVATGEGWVYVALVLDLFSRKFVGWALEAFVDTRLTLSALHMALSRRQPGGSLVHHSDRGVQYAAADYRAVLEERGITR